MGILCTSAWEGALGVLVAVTLMRVAVSLKDKPHFHFPVVPVQWRLPELGAGFGCTLCLVMPQNEQETHSWLEFPYRDNRENKEIVSLLIPKHISV